MTLPIRLLNSLGLALYTNLAASRVVLTLYALSLDASPFAVGALMAVYYIFPLLLSWPVGRLVDRFGAYGPLMFSALCGAAALLIPAFFVHIAALFVASAVSGLAMSVYNVTLQSLLGTLSTPEDRTRNVANLTLVGSASNFVGPLMAGYAVDHAGAALAPALMTTPCFIAVGLLLAWGRVLPPGSGKTPPRSNMLDSLRNPVMLRMLTVSALVQLGMDLFHFGLPLYGHSVGLSASAIGGVLAMFSLASFVVRTMLPKLMARTTELKMLALAFYLSGAAFLLIPVSGHAVALGAVAFLFGLAIGCSAPLTMMLMLSHSPEGRAGESMGLRLTVNNVVRVVGPTLFGSIGSALGLVVMFVFCALTMGVGGMLSRAPRPSDGQRGDGP
jgi:MFS family permease